MGKQIKGNYLGGTKWGHVLKGTPDHSPFVKGNRYAAAENMSPQSHKRRMKGLFKAWGARERKHRGERIVTAKTIKKIKKRFRVRLRENVVREAREIQILAKQYTTTAMKAVADIITSGTAKDSDIIAAAIFLHDRAYGKATQTSINANIDANGKPSEVSGKQLDQRIEEALKRAEELTGGTPKAPESPQGPDNLRQRDRNPGSSSVH